MIELYGMSSPNVIKIILMLEEMGAEWRLNRVDVLKCEQFESSFLALNPNGRVPVIIDHEMEGGPVTVFESGAILVHLAETRKALIPAEPKARAAVMQWLMLQMSGVGPMYGQFVHFSRFAPSGNTYAIDRYKAETQRLARVLNVRLAEADYLGGDYSIADIATYPWIVRFFGEGELLDRASYPALGRWIDRIGARPAVVRTNALVAEIGDEDKASSQQATPEQLDRLFNRKSSVAEKGLVSETST